MHHLLNAAAAAWLALLLVGPAKAQPTPATAKAPSAADAAKAPSTAAAPAATAFRTITWEALVPKDWDPMKDLKDLQVATLDDADPRAKALLDKMRAAWDNAPSNPAMEGKAVRIPGYVVPLEETADGMTEFLLVPYFGACIHSPPPPANQIVHVLPAQAARSLRSMDPVWVSGTLQRVRTDSMMGTAGYRLQAQRVDPYKPEGERRK